VNKLEFKITKFVDFRIDVKWRCRQESKVLYNYMPYKYLTTLSMI